MGAVSASGLAGAASTKTFPRPRHQRSAGNLDLSDTPRAFQLAHHGLRDRVGVRLLGWPRFAEVADDLPLPPASDLAVAIERRQHAFVAEVLAPCLEVLGGLAQRLSEMD